MRRLALLSAVGVALLAAPATGLVLLLPAGAAAQIGGTTSNPFSPALPSGPSTPTTPTASQALSNTSTSSGGGLSGGSAIAIALGAVVVLSGISFFIWRDARRRAPVRSRAAAAAAGAAGGGRTGTKPKPKPRKLSPAERRRRKRGRAR